MWSKVRRRFLDISQEGSMRTFKEIKPLSLQRNVKQCRDKEPYFHLFTKGGRFSMRNIGGMETVEIY